MLRGVPRLRLHLSRDPSPVDHAARAFVSAQARQEEAHQVLRLMVVKQQLLEKYSHLLPHSQYAAMRANRVLAQQAKAKEGKARTGPKGVKVYKDDTRMHDTAQAMAKELELPELGACDCDVQKQLQVTETATSYRNSYKLQKQVQVMACSSPVPLRS